jgi:hypothetical protein
MAPFLPGFLYAVLTGRDLDLPARVLGLLLLVSVPLGSLLGGAPGGAQDQALSGSR